MSTGRVDGRSEEVEQWHRLAERAIVLVNGLALFAGVVIAADIDVPGRLALATILCLFGPGSGLVLLVDRLDTAVRWVLTVGLSVACSVLIAQLLLSVHNLDSTLGALLLTAITASGLLRFVSRSRRSGGPS